MSLLPAVLLLFSCFGDGSSKFLQKRDLLLALALTAKDRGAAS